MIAGRGGRTKPRSPLSESDAADQNGHMTPPPIRYPLPSLILLILLGILIWRGEAWTRPLRAEARRRIDRALNGPPVPASNIAKTRGEIPRRGLLLRDGVPVFKTPRGESLAPIDKRGIVSIYDEWSSKGETAPPEFYRVGTRVPIGWIAASDLLPWDTRLVYRPSGIAVPRPIVGWNADGIDVVRWADGASWKTPTTPERIKPGDGAVGVLVEQVELPTLLSAVVTASDPKAVARLRLQAVLGEWSGDRSRADEQVAAGLKELPPIVASRNAKGSATERIAALNANGARPDVEWGGRSFRFVPLEALP